MKSDRKLGRLKGKTPQILFLAIVAIVIALVSLDTLEETLIEGGSFSGTHLNIILNAIIAFMKSVETTVQSWGYAGIFLLMLLEASSLPIPSEVILPLSGYLVSTGQLNMWITIIVSTVAGIVGSLIDYYIGMKGTDLLARRRVLDKILFNKKRLEMAAAWFNKYGAFTVFLGRMIPAFRTLVSFPAGAVRMPLRRFVAYTTCGCLVWNAFLVYVGVYLGTNWREVASISRYLIIGVVAAILVALVVYLITRKKNLTQAALLG